MPVIGEVTIARMALSHIGASSIESLSEDSAEAKEANTWYAVSRQTALEAFNWNFARKRQLLAVHGDAA